MERDDIIEYSLGVTHSEEAGKKIRKKIWMVTLLLTVITAVEVIVGAMFTKNDLGADSAAWMFIKVLYIALTLVKAGYIVLVFMHLGDERKSLKWTILAPYIFFILYLMILVVFLEGDYVNSIWETTKIK